MEKIKLLSHAYYRRRDDFINIFYFFIINFI